MSKGDKEFAQLQRMTATVTAATRPGEPTDKRATVEPPLQSQSGSRGESIGAPALPPSQKATNDVATPPRVSPEDRTAVASARETACATARTHSVTLNRWGEDITPHAQCAAAARDSSHAGSEARAIAAFFGGDYRRALDILAAVRPADRTPRGELYLACSRVAVILTSGRDATSLNVARKGFAALDIGVFHDGRCVTSRLGSFRC